MSGDARFRTTRWSMILSARTPEDPGCAEALATLCETYWYPLYVFVRRYGRDADTARDITQGFFLQLLEHDYLGDARPEAGRFRSFLLTSIKNYMANLSRDAAALKRGGGNRPLSLDGTEAEQRYRMEPVDDRTPDKAYERLWAMTVIDRAKQQLREDMERSGKAETHRLLAGYLSGDAGTRPYKQTAEELGVSVPAVKMAVSRLRKHFGTLLRSEIAQTVANDEDVDSEVRYLLSIVR